MRWIVSMFIARFKSALQQPFSWMFVLIAVGVSLFPALIGNDPSDSRLPVAVVVEDEGALPQRLIALFENSPDLSLAKMPRSKAMRLLAMDRLDAVFVIRNNYTSSLQHADFKNTIELYTSPSSSVSTTISEPIINGTLMLWIEEAAIIRTRNFLSAHGYDYTDADERVQRAQIKDTWENGAPLLVRTHISQPAKTVGSPGPAAACAQWYGAFAVFYIFVSAGYVIDICKKSLSLRIRSTGARMAHLLLGASLVPLILCMAGLILSLALCCVLSGVPVILALRWILPMLLYFGAVMGVTLFMASMIRHTIALLLLAPIVTFINAVLGGLLVQLPEWAAVLEALSRMMPGRELHEAIASGLPPAGLAVCCACWLLLGLCAALFRRMERAR